MGSRRWVIVGANGRVGTCLQRALVGQSVRTWTRNDADLTDREGVRRTLARIRAESVDPIVLLNTAAVADVDAAERDPRTADLVNAQAPGWLACGLGPADVLVHLSTDYVFGADAAVGCPYDEGAPTGPLSVYGATKRDGENAVLAARPDSYVVRTSWVFDADKPNFATGFRDQLLAGESVAAVTDQVSRPTATPDLVAGLIALVERRPDPGIYHLANTGQASRYDVAMPSQPISAPIRYWYAEFPPRKRRRARRHARRSRCWGYAAGRRRGCLNPGPGQMPCTMLWALLLGWPGDHRRERADTVALRRDPSRWQRAAAVAALARRCAEVPALAVGPQ